jgi:phosphinothricin acetyltransferase
MTPGVRIVPFIEKHVDAGCEIYNHYIVNSTSTFTTEKLSRDEFRSMVIRENPIYGTFAAEDAVDMSLLGYAYLGPYKDRQAYLPTAEVSVYLKPECTGRGIGKSLLDKLHVYARTQKFHALMALICDESAASIKLFSRAEYEKVAQLKEVGLKFGRRLDVLFFELILD